MDVHDPDSPYGLIQDVLTPSQSISNNLKPDLNSNDLGGLNTNEVLLSEGNLLILKGIYFYMGHPVLSNISNYLPTVYNVHLGVRTYLYSETSVARSKLDLVVFLCYLEN